MVKNIFELRNNLHYSFEKISRLLHCAATSAHAAYKRFAQMRDGYVDRRKFNGANNWKLKIVPKVQ